jgi:NAD(P)-dependent dehydrogenase (short-subunit alcohol dehydrogenase family)
MEESEPPRLSLAGKTALITGAGRGIGRAIALAIASQGGNLALAARTESELEAVADAAGRYSVRTLVLPLDVRDAEATCRAVDAAVTGFGRIDILVNNAGVADSRKFLELDDAFWDRIMDVNVKGPLHLTRAVLPAMLSRGDGTVIFVASIAGKIGGAYISAYSASKHAVLGLMRSLAAEYARSGVTFNAVCPAYVDTPMTERSVEGIMQKTGRSREQALQALYTPQGRLVRPEEVAAVCLLLASDAGRGINGQAINVDGGQVPW